jgi:restriction endonuclease Mrr
MLKKRFSDCVHDANAEVPPYFFAVEPDSESAVLRFVRELSDNLARLVARDPDYLRHIEWRDMERMLAGIFDRLGFKVVLTPSSHDGGKDLILSCEVSGLEKIYIVEVKHWPCGKKVGRKYVGHFIKVVAQEKRDGGLYLATYGYAENAIEAISEVDHEQIRLGDKQLIVSLCRTYTRTERGLWTRIDSLPEMLFSNEES